MHSNERTLFYYYAILEECILFIQRWIHEYALLGKKTMADYFDKAIYYVCCFKSFFLS